MRKRKYENAVCDTRFSHEKNVIFSHEKNKFLYNFRFARKKVVLQKYCKKLTQNLGITPKGRGVFWIDLRESRRQGEIGRLSYAQIISLPPFD